MLKKIISIFLCMIFCFTSISVFAADEGNLSIVLQIENSNMTVNGTEKEIDAAPVIIDGRTLLPVRAVVEEMGGDVSWNGEAKQATLNHGENEIVLTIDSETALLNNEEQKLDTAPVIIRGRTFLPIRFIAENFGYNVEWNGENKTVTINTFLEDDNNSSEAAQIDYLFGRGDLNPSASVFTGTSYLNNLIQNDDVFNFPSTYNVTFEPCTRTDWHSHNGGQILLVTEGTGIYQEEGQPARLMQPGDVIMAEPGVKHWHGASDNSWFAHVGISTNPENSDTNWLEKVSDEEYNAAVLQAKTNTEFKTDNTHIFGIGDLNPSSNVFTGTSYLNNLVQNDDVFNCAPIYNVTFEPCTRTDWHAHHGGQILLVTEGTGIYQEEGQPARLMQPGDVIMAEPGVKHWHGASDDGMFAHLGISTNPDNSEVDWLEKVSDEEYNAAVAQAKGETIASNVDAEENDKTSETESNTLIVYFSRTGTTKELAENIHSKIGGDIAEITPVIPYPEDYNQCIEQAQNEIRENARPEYTINIDDISKYDTILVGYPIWWSSVPPVVRTFLDNNDLSDKRIMPFCTHGGSGINGSMSNIRELCPNSDITEGLDESNDSAVNRWLSENGLN